MIQSRFGLPASPFDLARSPFGMFPRAVQAPEALSSASLPPPPPMAAPPSEEEELPVEAGLPPLPRKPGNLWDKKHLDDSLLAIGTGLLSGDDFFDGLGRAGQGLGQLRQQIRTADKPTRELGGPDDAFEVTYDPRTGERSYVPIQPFQDYLRKKAEKPAVTADIRGRAMTALLSLPEDQRQAAYEDMADNPSMFGLGDGDLPMEYDPELVDVYANMGMNVSQTMTREQAAANAKAQDAYRKTLAADRAERTRLAAQRTATLERQGDARIQQGEARVAQGASRLEISRANAGRSRSGGRSSSSAKPQYEYRYGPNGELQRRRK